jgi:hypothetical protein
MLVTESYRTTHRICNSFYFSHQKQFHNIITLLRLYFQSLSLCVCVFKLNYCSTLKLNFTHQVQRKIYFINCIFIKSIEHKNNLHQQASRSNIKIIAFRRIPLRSAKAYNNRYLALQNAMYSNSII